MNMFRNLFSLALIILGLGLWFTDPTTWHWVDMGGVYAVDTVRFLTDLRPFSYIILFVIALALWMTRKQF
jgi:hypothetical protein